MENVAYGFMIGSRPNETETKPTEKETAPDEILEIETGSIDDYTSRIYVTPEVAKEEIWKRWNNEDLKKEVEKFLGNDVPDCFKDGPKAVLARNIASPNMEMVHFLGMADKMELQPIFIEYLKDKLVSVNFDKRHLSRLFFYNGKGRQGGDKVSALDIVDMVNVDGQRICDVRTDWGEGFADFHHRLFDEMLPQRYRKNIFDASSWLERHGGNAEQYYNQYLALFLCHSVYAELFLLYTERDRKFFENTVVPAIATLEKRFGILPLIVSVSTPEKGADISWKYYPESMKQMIPMEFSR